MEINFGKAQLDNSLNQVRDKIINRIYFISMILVVPALIVSVYRYNLTGFKWLYLIQVVLELLLIGTYVSRNRLSVSIKTYLFLAFTLITTVSGLYAFGYFGESKSFLILVPIFAALFLNKKWAYWSLGLCALIFMGIAILYVSGFLTYDMDIERYISSPGKWLAMSFTYLTIMALLIYIVTTTLETQNEAVSKQVEKDMQLAGIAGALPGVVIQFKVRTDGSYNFTYVSSKAKDIFGLSSKLDHTNWTNFDMIHPDDRQDFVASIEEAVEKRSIWYFEGRIEMFPDKEKWFKGVSSPLEIGDELVYNGVLLDITSERKAQEAQFKEKRFSESLISNMPGVFFIFEITDNDYKLVQWNQNLISELGYSLEEIIFKDPYFFAPEDERKIIEEHLSKLQSEGHIEYETGIHKKNGEVEPYYINGQLLQEDDKTYFFASGTNVKELKDVQAELDEHRLHLKKLVRDRTEDLQTTNEDLVIANEDLENALKRLQDAQDRLVQSEKLASIGTFVAGIAHEINNPLNFIAGGQNILGHSLEDFEQHQGTEEYEDLETAHEMISDGMARVSNIVKALMTFSFSGQSVLQDADINKILDNSLLFLKTKIGDDIKISKAYDLETPVPVFEEKVHQIFLNVLDNAIYATSQQQENVQKQLIISSLIIKENDQEYATVKIYNTGPPISEEKIKQIFDPFYTTKQPGEGTGLGLSITYSLVQEHQGNINVINCESGVEFEIRFPFTRNEVSV